MGHNNKIWMYKRRFSVRLHWRTRHALYTYYTHQHPRHLQPKQRDQRKASLETSTSPTTTDSSLHPTTIDGPDATMLQSHIDTQSSSQHQEQEDTGLMMTGQQRQQQWTSHRQVQQTSRKAQRVEPSTTTWRKNTWMPGKPKASRHLSKQQHRNELSMSSHSFLAEVRVRHVSKTKDEQTISKHNKCEAIQLLALILSCQMFKPLSKNLRKDAKGTHALQTRQSCKLRFLQICFFCQQKWGNVPGT